MDKNMTSRTPPTTLVPEDEDGWSLEDERRWQDEEARIDAYNDALDASIRGRG